MTEILKNLKSLKRGYLFGQLTFYKTKHLGLDIIAPVGTPIYAWKDLGILSSFYGADGGNQAHIRVSGGKELFRIMHLQKKPLKGSYKEGEIIAYVGNTGKLSKGSHLHIDISKNGVLNLKNFANFEDPEKYFNSLKNDMLKIIGHSPSGRQFALGTDEKLHWIKNVETLNSFHNSGVIDKNKVTWMDSLVAYQMGDVWNIEVYK